MIGIYDTGFGGLAIIKEVLKKLPDLDLIYLADQKNLPLGGKTGDQIQEITKNGIATLFDLNCDLVLLACNTATVNTIRHLQQVWLVEKNLSQTHNILGVSQPLLEILEYQKSKLTAKNGLLMATPATYKSGFYQSEVKQRGYFRLKTIACPRLADTVEIQNPDIVRQTLEQICHSQKIEVVDIQYLVLACTHYCWIETELREFFGKNIEIINPAQEIALKLEKYLMKYPKYLSQNSTQKFLINNLENLEKYTDFIQKELRLDGLFELI